MRGVAEGAARGVEDDLARVARLLREAILQQVRCALGLGARQREVVDVAGADAGGEQSGGDDEDDPGRGDEPAAIMSEGGEAVHARHLRTLSAKLQCLQFCAECNLRYD